MTGDVTKHICTEGPCHEARAMVYREWRDAEEEIERLKLALKFARDKYEGTIHMKFYNPQVIRRYDEEIEKILKTKKPKR